MTAAMRERAAARARAAAGTRDHAVVRVRLPEGISLQVFEGGARGGGALGKSRPGGARKRGDGQTATPTCCTPATVHLKRLPLAS